MKVAIPVPEYCRVRVKFRVCTQAMVSYLVMLAYIACALG